uniref:Large ribosomal subunit protein bL33c n=1 Tax=Cliftonaea pectinata TaxID=2007206 RepID=A0A1Z1MQM5_9FLOR|nr:ribosomal protein L33 [Cliftonaea pectinata]ARW68152.1 ribosomal protein L33 [Cliftonaea pectinata]
MPKNKGARITITLECECRSSSKESSQKKDRKNGLFRYTTSKNKRNTPNKLEINKFCPYCNCHNKFKEIK